MTTEPKSSSQTPSAGQQRRQASILLLRLQWVFILLLILALVWLYVDQQRFERQVGERLQLSEQMATRLGEMDDRLYAISQKTVTEPMTQMGSQAQNQLDLFKIQIQAADRLLADDNYSATIELLRGLEWQLSQSSNEIAPALTIVIKQSLKDDIERLQAQSNQPSGWQLQNIAIQNIQAFLHSYEQNGSHKRPKSSGQNNHHEQLNNKNRVNRTDDNLSLSRRQLTIHEVIMTLNLAMQASNMREQDQLTNYLTVARSQLKTLVPPLESSKKNTAQDLASAPVKNAHQNPSHQTQVNNPMDTPKDLVEVIDWLDKLIANAPKPKPLLTTQILEQPSSK